MFLDTSSNLYYLRDETYWFQAADPKGPWGPAQKLPDGFYKLPADDNWKDVKANIPGKTPSKSNMPMVFFSTTPAEMILMDGAPKYAPVKGTSLLWVSNTESDIFRMKDASFYFLVSGRWFSAANLDGPWTFATPDLPADFLKIPGDHERARVLASVPGSRQAAEAVLLAQVPQTARVNAKEIKAPEVKYAGDPQFQSIEGSSVTYASNASHDVVLVGNTYYLCSMGVWFSSGSPNGPWLVTTSVPSAVYGIPPSAPVYSVTYVTVVNPDPYYPVYAYTPGYMGVTVSYGCVMYGTGYYYPPYYHYPPYGPPIYYPRPPSYGCGAMYNPHTGAYGYYQTAYGPYGGVACGASYNPYTGTYKRGAVAYGPYGSAGYAQAYNPRTGAYGQTAQGSNAYGSWGSSSVQRGDDWAKTQRVTDSQGNTKWTAQGSGGGSAAGWNGQNSSAFVGEKNGNMYAGKDGNVYRKTDDGWQSYSGGANGGWNDVNSPQGKSGATAASGAQAKQGQAAAGGAAAAAQPSNAARPAPSSDTMGQLNHDAQSRSQGDQRTAASSSAASGARSGGASRSGGGRWRTAPLDGIP